MTTFPVEIWLMILKHVNLAELANIWRTCKILEWAVSVELCTKMKVGLYRGKSSLVMEQSYDRRMETLKKHPLPAAIPSSSGTKKVFRQHPRGSLFFQDVDVTKRRKQRLSSMDCGLCPANRYHSLLLHHSSDVEFLHLVFPDQMESCVYKGDTQYSFYCIYRSYDHQDPNPWTRANPRASLMNLKLVGIRVLRTDIANSAVSMVCTEFLRKRLGMSLPLMAEMELDMHCCSWDQGPVGEGRSKGRGWWGLKGVELVLG